MAPKRKPVIRKVFLDHKVTPPSNISFPSMPTMYLELLENKDKIKQQLVNNEYIPPKEPLPPADFRPMSVRLDELLEMRPIQPQDDFSEDENESPLLKPPKPPQPPPSIISVDDDSDEDDKYSDAEQSSSDADTAEYESEGEGSYSHSNKTRSASSHNSYSTTVHSERNSPFPEKTRLPMRLPPVRELPREPPPPVSKPIDFDFDIPQRQTTSNPYSSIPSLAELNVQPEPVIPNLNYMHSDTTEEDNKRELLFKFDLLKKSYKDTEIPEFSIHSDYKNMKQSYDMTLRRLAIDSSVDNYKTYLIGGFMVVEYALGNWMGFDMQGFTQQQITSMSSYERLLIELGEKSYVDEESQWPVEVRLFGLIIMNAAFFIVSKMIMKKTGSNILSMINSMNIQPPPMAKKRRMKGPNIDLDHLPDLSGLA